jgi:D-alanyl-D-alanine carboxypeptidase/D-alanyl-D-alanine-endopeptidase (penicillin-binding protein 4)
VHPSPHGLAERYAVSTVSSRELEVLVGATRSAVTVRGKIPAGHAPYLAEFAHPDPILLFGTVLRAALAEAGIRVHGETLRRRGNTAGRRLYELRSPLEELLEPINAESRNGVSDQLFLALGQALGSGGTRAGGAEAIGLALQSLDVPVEGLVAVDGSGLSRDNRVSARQITALIAAVLRHENDGTARLFRDSLAVMGESGTLEGRLRGSHAQGCVFAKTGWIRGTSALSGIVDTGCPGAAVFSILVEYPPELGGLNNSCFKKMQDEIVLLIASHIEDLR